jgi:RHS repeat-associated protein
MPITTMTCMSIGTEEDGYYSPVVRISGRTSRNSYQYKFNSKEWQDELKLNMYDYGFRNYMPDVVRWFNIDPLAEKYYDTSPYTYVKNNPITTIDPDGRYLFGLFGSTSSERRMARAEQFAGKIGGSVVVGINGRAR